MDMLQAQLTHRLVGDAIIYYDLSFILLCVVHSAKDWRGVGRENKQKKGWFLQTGQQTRSLLWVLNLYPICSSAFFATVRCAPSPPLDTWQLRRTLPIWWAFSLPKRHISLQGRQWVTRYDINISHPHIFAPSQISCDGGCYFDWPNAHYYIYDFIVEQCYCTCNLEHEFIDR